MSGLYYKLVDEKVIPCEDVKEWSKYFEKNRKIKYTKISETVSVSTVFLGIDHSFNEMYPPILFESMIFGGDQDQFQQRYNSIEDAKKGHEDIVLKLQSDSEFDDE